MNKRVVRMAHIVVVILYVVAVAIGVEWLKQLGGP